MPSSGAGTPHGDPGRLIRDKIARGLLPTEPPLRLWGGRGSGRSCDACDAPIGPHEAEHELEFSAGQTLRFHVACSDAWRRAVSEGGKISPGPEAGEEPRAHGG